MTDLVKFDRNKELGRIEKEHALKGKTIFQIEKSIENERDTALKHTVHTLEQLFYVQCKNLWRDNPMYKNASWAEYLQSRWKKTPSQFVQERILYLVHPKECEEFGPGTTQKIIKRCGQSRASDVFVEIRKLKDTKKKMPELAAIEKVIEKHAPQSPETRPVISYTPPPKVFDDLRDENRELHRQNAEMAVQIEKLKDTVIKTQQENLELKQQIKKMRKTIKRLEDGENADRKTKTSKSSSLLAKGGGAHGRGGKPSPGPGAG